MSHCGKLKFFFPSNKLLLDGKFGKIHLTVRTVVNMELFANIIAIKKIKKLIKEYLMAESERLQNRSLAGF